MQIDISPMLRGEVTVIPFAETIALPEDFFEDGIRSVEPLSVHGKIENMAGYMRLTAHTEVSYIADCARCLAPVPSTLTMEFERNIAARGTLTDEDNDDYLIADDGIIELEEPVEEQLLLEFPMRHLCREDCKGLCPVCGKNLNEGPCNCVTKTADPRLAVLRKLLEKDEESGDGQK